MLPFVTWPSSVSLLLLLARYGVNSHMFVFSFKASTASILHMLCALFGTSDDSLL